MPQGALKPLYSRRRYRGGRNPSIGFWTPNNSQWYLSQNCKSLRLNSTLRSEGTKRVKVVWYHIFAAVVFWNLQNGGWRQQALGSAASLSRCGNHQASSTEEEVVTDWIELPQHILCALRNVLSLTDFHFGSKSTTMHDPTNHNTNWLQSVAGKRVIDI